MNSFLKIWLKLFAIISAIFIFFGSLLWSLSKVFGEDGVLIGLCIIVVFFVSLIMAAAIEGNL
jgi:hypothetical protein